MQKDYKYSLYAKPFTLGNLYDTSLYQVDSFAAETLIPFGAPVIRGTDTRKQVKLATVGATPTSFIGIALRQSQMPSGGILAPDDTGNQVVIMSTASSAYPIGAPVPVARSGRVIVFVTTVTQAIVGTTRAIYTMATGLITTQTAEATPNTQLDLGFILTEPVAGELCAIQINKFLQ